MSRTWERSAPEHPHPNGRLRFVLAPVLGLLIGTVLFAPARWLAAVVERASQGQVLLRNTHGTVWQGRADVLLAPGTGSGTTVALPQGLQWAFSAVWAQGPALQLQLHAPCCTPTPMVWRVRYAAQGLSLALLPHRSQWPLAWLSGLGAPWNTIQLQGTLQLQTEGAGLTMSWGNGQLRQSGVLDARALNTSSSLSTLKPLGNYQLLLEPDPQGASRFRLSTLSGDLTLRADGEWANGHLRLRGLAEAAPQRIEALSNLLNILGQRDGARAHLRLG